jgi:hypothetical protein
MMKVLNCLILTIGLLAVASWLTPARSETPVVGDVARATNLCREAAIAEIVEKFRTNGSAAARNTFRLKVNGNTCYSFQAREMRIISVSAPVETTDGYTVYVVGLEFMGVVSPEKPWFSIHLGKIAGQGA